MEINRYREVKENAYVFVSLLEKDKLMNLIDGIKISDQEEKTVFVNTILYPNDQQIFEMYSQNHNINALSKELGIPSNILFSKILEYQKFKFNELIEDQHFDGLIAQSLKKTK